MLSAAYVCVQNNELHASRTSHTGHCLLTSATATVSGRTKLNARSELPAARTKPTSSLQRLHLPMPVEIRTQARHHPAHLSRRICLGTNQGAACPL